MLGRSCFLARRGLFRRLFGSKYSTYWRACAWCCIGNRRLRNLFLGGENLWGLVGARRFLLEVGWGCSCRLHQGVLWSRHRKGRWVRMIFRPCFARLCCETFRALFFALLWSFLTLFYPWLFLPRDLWPILELFLIGPRNYRSVEKVDSYLYSNQANYLSINHSSFLHW